MLGRRRRRYPSLEAFVASLHQRRQGRRSDEDFAGALRSSPLRDEGKTPTMSASLTSSSGPEAKWDSTHCNGPRREKRVTGLICNSLFCNDGL
jgi:hypothetical protein